MVRLGFEPTTSRTLGRYSTNFQFSSKNRPFVTSRAKTFLTVCRFEMVAIHKPFISRFERDGMPFKWFELHVSVQKNCDLFEWLELSVQKNCELFDGSSYLFKKIVSCSNGSSYPFKKNMSRANGLSYPFKKYMSRSNGLSYLFKKYYEPFERLDPSF